MSKEYKVWIEVEEHDLETDKYENQDSLFGSTQTFDNLEEATAFAECLNDVGQYLGKDGHSTIEKIMSSVLTVITSFVQDLESIGFGTDDPVSGSDAVDAINQNWENLKLIAG